MDYTEFYKKQISLTEWFQKINSPLIEAIREEDNGQKKRLKELHSLMQLPIDESFIFPATEVVKKTAAITEFIHSRGEKLIALRLTPNDLSLPKYRIRGITTAKALEWFNDQPIKPELYKAEFGAHSETVTFTTIFVANRNGIFGEIIHGLPLKLTQGLYAENEKPILFAFDYHQLTLEPDNPEAKEEVKHIIQCLHVTNLEIQKQVQEKMNVKFNQNYLQGYFETATTPEEGLTFLDYNRLLGEKFAEYKPVFSSEPISKNALKGIVAHAKGAFIGNARIVLRIENTPALNANEVLICPMTTPDFIPLMQQAGAIVTDMGGLLSHAAIIARELNKPCIVGTQKATQMFKEGDKVEIDTVTGTVRKI